MSERDVADRDLSAEGMVGEHEVAAIGVQAGTSLSQPTAEQLKKDRANLKRTHTQQIAKLKTSVKKGQPSETIKALLSEISNLFEQVLATHIQLSVALGRPDNKWVADLNKRNDEAHKLARAYLQGQKPDRVETRQSNATVNHLVVQPATTGLAVVQPARGTGSHLDRAVANAPIALEVGDDAHRSSSAHDDVRELGDVEEYQAVGPRNGTVRSRGSSNTSRQSSVRPLDGTVVSQRESITSQIGRPLSYSRRESASSVVSCHSDAPSSIRSGSRRSIFSDHVSLSTLTRERQLAELELEMIRERRKEEQEEETRLAELRRRLEQEERRVIARKRERQLEDDVARLRASEAMRLSGDCASSIASIRHQTQDRDASFLDCSRKRSSNENKPALASASGLPLDRWIDELSNEKPVSTNPLNPVGTLLWPYVGNFFSCKRPFDGDPREWPVFISRFKALVHDVVPDDVQRGAILADWVGPTVRRRIETLLLAPKGYAAAMEYLKRQYGASDKTARCQIYDLLKLSSCKMGEHQALQNLADRLHGVVVVLQQGGHEHDLKSTANLEQVVQKLPMGIRARWARYVRKRHPQTADLTDLDRFLEGVVEEERLIRPTEELLQSKPEQKKTTVRPSEKTYDKGANKTKSPPTVLATQIESEPTPACPACSQTHLLISCPDFKSKAANERAQLAKSLGLCFKCLRGKHQR